MARSIETLYNLIIAEKEARTELDVLSSTSATAIWRLWAWVTAAVLYTVELMHDLFRTEITTLLQTLKPGTLLWYREMCKAFQFGDDLAWVNGAYVYPVIDAEKQIIAQCSVSEGQRGLVVKVAREVSGALEVLTAEQEAAFTAYVGRRKYAGTKVSIVNSAANLLKVIATVVYDPLLFNSSGELLSDGTRPVDVAIENYLRNLPFNGRLRVTALVDAIQAVDGVMDVGLVALSHKYGANPYASIAVSHVPESGYFKIDPDFALSATITYSADV